MIWRIGKKEAAESAAKTDCSSAGEMLLYDKITSKEIYMRLIISLFLCGLVILSGSEASAQSTAANPTFADCSIASLSGSSQTLGTAFTLGTHAYNRKYLLICNTGTSNVGVNLTGGTAALSGAGTMTLVPGSCKEYASGTTQLPNPPANGVAVIGTSSQPVLCIEGR